MLEPSKQRRTQMTLGQNIARLRTQKNLSQGDLADALEVSRQSVSKWETDASIPELDKLLRRAGERRERTAGGCARRSAGQGERGSVHRRRACGAAGDAADRRHDPAVLRRADRDTHHALRRNARRLYTGAAAVCLRDHLPDGEAAHQSPVRCMCALRCICALPQVLSPEISSRHFHVCSG